MTDPSAEGLLTEEMLIDRIASALSRDAAPSPYEIKTAARVVLAMLAAAEARALAPAHAGETQGASESELTETASLLNEAVARRRLENPSAEEAAYLDTLEQAANHYDPSAVIETRRGDPAPANAEGWNIKTLLDRFLQWPLPKSVRSDLCVTKDYAFPRSGTNLLSAEEARQMIEYLLAAAPAAPPSERALTTCPKCRRTKLDRDCAEDACPMASARPTDPAPANAGWQDAIDLLVLAPAEKEPIQALINHVEHSTSSPGYSALPYAVNFIKRVERARAMLAAGTVASPSTWTTTLLLLRDALVAEDQQEAYHQLRMLVDPENRVALANAGNHWAELEAGRTPPPSHLTPNQRDILELCERFLGCFPQRPEDALELQERVRAWRLQGRQL